MKNIILIILISTISTAYAQSFLGEMTKYLAPNKIEFKDGSGNVQIAEIRCMPSSLGKVDVTNLKDFYEYKLKGKPLVYNSKEKTLLIGGVENLAHKAVEWGYVKAECPELKAMEDLAKTRKTGIWKNYKK